MDWKNHLVVGFLVGIATFCIGYFVFDFFELSLIGVLIYIAIVFLYSLSPDLDHQLGKLTWIFLTVSIIGLGIGIFVQGKFLIPSYVLLVLTFLCAKFMPHRGFIHSLIFGLIVSVPLYFISNSLEYPILALVSFWSHLLADKIPLKLS